MHDIKGKWMANFICTKCNKTDIRIFKVIFSNKTEHCLGVCYDCGNKKYLNKLLFFDHDLPVFDFKELRSHLLSKMKKINF